MEGDVITRLVKPIFAVPNVVGIALMERERTIFDSMPGRDGTADSLRNLLWDFFEGYAKVGRKVAQCYLSVGSQFFFAMSFGDLKLAVLAKDRADLDAISKACNAVSSQITGDPSSLDAASIGNRKATRVRILRWAECEEQILSVLTKVVSSSQAGRILEREFADRRITRDQPVTADQIRMVVEDILLQVPIKSKRELLRTELEHALSEFSV